MASITFDGFFDLPGELREQILTYLLVKPDGVHINTRRQLKLLEGTSLEYRNKRLIRLYRYNGRVEMKVGVPGSSIKNRDGDEDEPSWPVNYFLASQALHREASAVFFGDNEFHLYDIFTKRLQLRYLRPWPLATDKDRNARGYEHLDSLRRIRRAVLHARRVGDGLEGFSLPTLREMTLSGGLKQLDVRLSPTAQQKARGAASLWGSEPGMRLLGLLRDPDLNVVRLRLRLDLLPWNGNGEGKGKGEGKDGEEIATWCPRREGSDGRLVTMTIREGRVWCDLDVGELARRYGGEEVGIFKVGERPMVTWTS